MPLSFSKPLLIVMTVIWRKKKSHKIYVKKYPHESYMKYTWKEKKTWTSLDIHTKRALYIYVHSFHFHVKLTRRTSNEITFRDIIFDGFISYKNVHMSGDNATVCLLSDTFLSWSFNSRPLSIKSFISLVLIFDFSLIKETKVGVISKTLYDANITQITIYLQFYWQNVAIIHYVEIKKYLLQNYM